MCPIYSRIKLELSSVKEEQDKSKTKEKLKYRRIDYSSAKELFKFKIFSTRKYGKVRYRLGKNPPDLTYNELESMPARAVFEKAVDEKYAYLRMIVDNYPDPNCVMKIRRKL